MSRILASILAVAALVVASGCGGAQPGVSDAVTLAPRDTLALVEIDSSMDSKQWEAAQTLLDRFPDGDELLGKLRSELGEEGVDLDDLDAALGDRVVVVVLARSQEDPAVVALTQPDDVDRLRELLKEDKEVELRGVSGWTAIGERADLDLYERALDAGTLDGDARYEAAAAKFPEEALATAYVNGAAVKEVLPKGAPAAFGKLEWLSLALEAQERGVRLAGTLKGAQLFEAESVDGDLLDLVPGNALGVIAFGENSALQDQLDVPGVEEFERMVGIDFDRLAELLGHGGVLWATPSLLIPTFTFVIPDGDADDADALLTRLAALADVRPETAELNGKPAKRLDFGPVALTYGEVDGRLVLTTASSLEKPDETLEDSEAFGSARDAAGMPDETQALLYLDLRQLIPLIEGLAGLSDDEVDPMVSRNLKPLASALAYATADGDESRFALFLEIR